jgi:hypothetical protein
MSWKRTVRTIYGVLFLLPLCTGMWRPAVADDSSAAKQPYIPSNIRDLGFDTRASGELPLDNRTLDYTLSYQSKHGQVSPKVYAPHNVDHIRALMLETWPIFTAFLSDHSIPRADCRANYNLHLFVVEQSVLYDSSRFGAYFKKNNKPPSSLWGYYDSTLEIERNSIIIVANISATTNDAIFAHEFAHYFWDRLCIANHWAKESEDFAQAFERYFKRER